MNSKEELQKRRAELSTAKKELLTKRLRLAMIGESNRQSIPKRSQESNVPLSFAQQSLWFLQQLEPENPMYNETMALRLTGALNWYILQQTLQEIARRHE